MRESKCLNGRVISGGKAGDIAAKVKNKITIKQRVGRIFLRLNSVLHITELNILILFLKTGSKLLHSYSELIIAHKFDVERLMVLPGHSRIGQYMSHVF